MKKVFYLAMALVCSISVMATNYNYKAAITKVSVENQSYGTTYKFKVSLTQTCLNTSDNKTYDSTADLFLVSETPDLEGTYSVSSGSINPDLSAIYYGNNTRRPNPDKPNTFTIVKKDATHYEIGNGVINVQNMQGTNQYCYNYSYSTSDWTVNTPFAFTYGSTGEDKTEPHVHYDMTVNKVYVERNDNDYGSIRYFMTLDCTGKRRDNNTNYNYEVQLDILPTSASISGTFATTGSAQILAPTDTYVKWIQSETSSKTRYVAKDSISTITIKNNGTNQYKFCGGTLICQDVTFGVMGDKQINQTLYYHFNDELDFYFDENDPTATGTEAARYEAVGRKVLRGGRVMIERDGVIYNTLGQMER